MNRTDQLNAFIDNAFREDIGDGDHSTLSCIPFDALGASRLIVKDSGVLAGIEVAQQIFHRWDANLQVEVMLLDGATVKYGDVAFIVRGRIHSILQTERLVLNVMQRMSGIATCTQKYVKLLEGLHTQVLDTRKTTPGMRFLEKEAVRIGGGTNHRMGLYDMVMLKDNHVDFAGGIQKAVEKTKAYLKEKGKHLKIEVEVRNLNELQQVLDVGGVDRVMLDNFDIESTRKAVEQIGDRNIETESSGGITLSTFRDYAACGVDYISVGALTHSVQSFDLSLKAI